VTVTFTAVGWCAKSVTTRMPAAMPSSSCRRFTPRNRRTPSRSASTSAPSLRAIATAARMLPRLYAPTSVVDHSPSDCPRSNSSNSVCPPPRLADGRAV
jgi:hypothetical protein